MTPWTTRQVGLVKTFSCLAVLLLTGCAAFHFPHVAVLAVGDSGSKVLADASHVLGQAKKGGQLPVRGEDGDGVEVRIFDYSSTHDLALYFYNGLFIQLELLSLEKNMGMHFRKDYRDILNRTKGPDAYVIKKRGPHYSIEVLTKKRPVLN